MRYNDTGKVVIRYAKGVKWGLKQLVERILENLSTRDVFLFRIRCGACGGAYATRAIRFSKAGVTPPTKEKQILFDAVYEQELRGARQLAVSEAAQQVNYCPICKRLVCNSCFMICEDLDMCGQCASRLHEKGVPVLSEVLEAVM